MEIKKTKVSGGGIKVTLEKEGQVLARAYLYVLSNDLHQEPFGLMEDVFVNETRRGQGLGTRVVNELIQEAKKQKCYKLITTSRYERPKVHKLYQRLGFRDHGKEFRMDF
ncbi:GNAT family N-acetyltransferase [Patescibacteria group bacterium]